MNKITKLKQNKVHEYKNLYDKYLNKGYSHDDLRDFQFLSEDRKSLNFFVENTYKLISKYSLAKTDNIDILLSNINQSHIIKPIMIDLINIFSTSFLEAHINAEEHVFFHSPALLLLLTPENLISKANSLNTRSNNLFLFSNKTTCILDIEVIAFYYAFLSNTSHNNEKTITILKNKIEELIPLKLQAFDHTIISYHTKSK